MESSSHGLTGIAWKSALVAIAAFAFLAYPVERTGIAAAFSNPVDRIHAQDESVYADASLHAAAHGNWLTPVTMGRIYLGKPPLLYIFTGLSFKIFGISLFALRLPCLLAGSLTAALLFTWGARMQGLWTGALAALLLVSNPVWDIFSRLCYTDMLVAFFSAGAMFFLARDPTLESGTVRWGFIVFDAGAILSKSVAGVLPILALLAFCIVADRRPRWVQILKTIGGVVLLAAPWHVYQLLVHTHWFWADYIQVQLLQVGVKPSGALAPENSFWFYGKRLFLTDPLLLLLAVFTVPALIVALKRREAEAKLLASWLGVVVLAILGFQWRSFPYALLLIAPLCLIAALWTPTKFQPWMCAAAALFFAWTVTYPAHEPLRAASILRSYRERGRSNELILVDTDDEFSSATIPLRRVRYVFRDPGGATARMMPHYVDLGITVTADRFNELKRWEPEYRERLRAWHSDSSEAIATTIIATSDADVARIIQAHPEDDFYLPAALAPSSASSHVIERVSADRVLLLARNSVPVTVSRWPTRW